MRVLVAGATVGVGARAVEVADFNGDGIPDLVVANYGEDTISVLLGNGDGTFQPQQKHAVGILPIDLVVGDFNGFGTMDLAVANHGGFVEDTISVLLGWGTGQLDPQVKYEVGVTPTSVASGDLNQNGVLDLAVGHLYNFETVSVLLGHGNGTFAPAIDFEAGEYPVDVVLGDVTGNGVPDMVVGEWGGGLVSVLVNETAPGPVLGDLNGDGVVDVSDLLILLGAWGPCPRSNHCPADLNGDGVVDVTDLLILLGNWG
jgi:hypothetical protein